MASNLYYSKIAEHLKIQTMPTKNLARLEELEERNKKLEERIVTLDMALDIALKKLAELDPKFKAKEEECGESWLRKGHRLNLKESNNPPHLHLLYWPSGKIVVSDEAQLLCNLSFSHYKNSTSD